VVSSVHADDRKPVIGIEADVVVDPVTGAKKATVDQHYVAAVKAAGGTPLVLSPFEETAEGALAKIDAVVLTGGADVPPALYGEESLTHAPTVDPARLAFGRGLVKLALERGVPILGICYGDQLLNVVRGGKLLQDIPTSVPNAEPHRANGTFSEHEITTEPGTRLAASLGEKLHVNSNHHESVIEPGRGLHVAARAPDGVVEAVESDDPAHFILGVQWHPERMGDGPAGAGIFKSLVAAATSRLKAEEGIPLDITRVVTAARRAEPGSGAELAREREHVEAPVSRGFASVLADTVDERVDEVRDGER
jgi:putative glutamine amidotransferase